MRRYQMLRFGSFVGFKPPYFIVARCGSGCIAPHAGMVIWGDDDRMVPRPTAKPTGRAAGRSRARMGEAAPTRWCWSIEMATRRSFCNETAGRADRGTSDADNDKKLVEKRHVDYRGIALSRM